MRGQHREAHGARDTPGPEIRGQAELSDATQARGRVPSLHQGELARARVEAFAEDDEEASSVEGTPATDEVEEGMHEVEDDAETVDFSEDADGAKDHDEDEDE